ncbi:MAG: DUF3373 domain-containing protein [Acidobacteriia bacterium]|nr:DUF3373 domain-containing protein [Terriglobia bacterium]
MRRFYSLVVTLVLLLAFAASAQNVPAATSTQPSPAAGDENTQLRQELDQMKKAVAALEERLTTQEKAAQEKDKKVEVKQALAGDQPTTAELATEVKDLDHRMSQTERRGALDRINFTGDYRFEAHSIWGNVPAHYDGMQLQNLVVKTLFYVNTNGGLLPPSIDAINNNVAQNYAGYQYFTNNLTFSELKAVMAQFPPSMQQQLFGMLQPATLVGRSSNDTSILYTNRLRLNLDSKINDDLSVTARLSMYKAWGDSTGVQVFNGQPSSMNIDGTTAGVPNSDMLRVERAYFTWNHVGGSPLYLSIGRRPSTEGPPLNFRNDEPRGGTPSGALIDFQFDGITVGYHFNDKMVWRLCYGVGYQAGFGNGNILKSPADRLKDTHLMGVNLDLYSTEKTFVQATYAHAFNVTDGFNGLLVLPVNPVTGDPVNAPVVMRYTPSTNLGAINLFGVNLNQKVGNLDLYASANYSGTRPNGTTSPFGGLMSDPFETPVDRNGGMFYVGARYSIPKDDGRTKVGFEFNHGTKYWFNFAQAEDDIIAPKTSTRGDVYETYVTHRIYERFILKLGYIRYNYNFSGSGWHVGAPKDLNTTAILGFPTYKDAQMLSLGLTTRF